MAKNPAESLLARLKNAARELGVTTEMALRRYTHERLLSLLNSSGHADAFCLKGGVLLGAILEKGALRPTDDIDFNGMDGEKSVEHLQQVLKEICSAHDGSDGLVFDLETMKVLKDRDGTVPGGKVSMMAYVGRTRIPLRIDVGYGNAITPRAVRMELPTILPALLPPTAVSVYPIETTVAEKLHAMHRHGETNTRIKDYFDIWQLSLAFPFDGEDLSAAIANTFSQHGDGVPSEFSALGDGFAVSTSAKRQWAGFTKMVKTGQDVPLEEVVGHVRAFVSPAAEAARGGPSPGEWSPGEGWGSPPLLRMQG